MFYCTTPIFFTSTREVMFSLLFVCLSVCLLATLRTIFRTDLHEIFREGWQSANEQNDKILVAIWITDPDPYRDTGKTCLGVGMHCPSASSLECVFRVRQSLFTCVSPVGLGLQYSRPRSQLSPTCTCRTNMAAFICFAETVQQVEPLIVDRKSTGKGANNASLVI